MDPLDIVSKAIVGITKSYGKKVGKKTERPDIPEAKPVSFGGDAYKLGFSKAEIMPDLTKGKTYYIAGHGSGHVMEGVLSPVYVHAVYISCGGEEGIIWLSADIVGLTNTELQIIRDRIYASGKMKGIKAVTLSCTHSHSGIDTIGYWGKPFLSIPADGKDPEYMNMLFDKAVQVAEEAYANAKSGKLYCGKVRIPDGLYTGRLFADKHEILTRVRFAPADGSRETWIMNFGGHPNSLGGSNRLLSGEYPYFMREHIAEEKGADVFYCIGAVGGMDCAEYETEVPLERVKYQARLIADYSYKIEDETELEPEVKVLRQEFYMPVDNNVLLLLAMKGTMSFKAYPDKISSLGVAMKTEMTYFSLGSQKFLTLPGENFINTVYGGYMDAEHSTTGKGPEINPKPLCEIANDEGMVAIGVTNDMTGYVVPPNDFILNKTQPYLNGTKDRFGKNHYHETNSMGPNSQKTIADTFATVVKNFG